MGHGNGPDYPDYVDCVLSAEAPDPFDFNSFLTLADNMESLGLGQVDAPTTVVWDLEDSEHREDLNDVLEDKI